MTRKEYEKYISDNNIDLEKLNIYIGRKTNIPYSYGCFEEDSVWKAYMVGERQDFGIGRVGTEEEIFSLMYNITLNRINSSPY